MTKVRLMAASAAALLVVTALGMSGCASCARIGKSLSSNMDGGLQRTVTLYDYQGGIVVCEED